MALSIFNTKETEMQLSNDQQKALNLMRQGKDIFLTGEAGTGKSFVLEIFIDEMKKQGKQLLVTAPTGIAALNIGGATIHSTFNAPTSPIANKNVSKVPKVVKKADILIIDEISMCRIDLFEFIMRTITLAEKQMMIDKKGLHIQLIFVGDFFQLPPVATPKDREILEELYPHSKKYYAFESNLWADRGFKIVNLKQMMRQDDPILINQLNKARKGDIECIKFFNKRIRQQPIKDAITLCATNREAHRINEQEIKSIKYKSRIYESQVEGDFPDKLYPTQKSLKVKKTMRVMAIKNENNHNAEQGYQNGSLGTVIGAYSDVIRVQFDDGYTADIEPYTWENVKYELNTHTDKWGQEQTSIEQETLGKFTQFPLKPAYAVTMHKSQGQTFDKINLIPFAFDAGQLYVALSRVRTLNGLCLLTPINSDFLICDQTVLNFYNSYSKELIYGVPKHCEQQYILLGKMFYELSDKMLDIKDKQSKQLYLRIKQEITKKLTPQF